MSNMLTQLTSLTAQLNTTTKTSFVTGFSGSVVNPPVWSVIPDMVNHLRFSLPSTLVTAFWRVSCHYLPRDQNLFYFSLCLRRHKRAVQHFLFVVSELCSAEMLASEVCTLLPSQFHLIMSFIPLFLPYTSSTLMTPAYPNRVCFFLSPLHF